MKTIFRRFFSLRCLASPGTPSPLARASAPVAFLATSLLVVVGTALAPRSGAEEDLTPKVLALFEAKCRECHHADTLDEFPYLHEGVTVADLIEEEMLVPGDPDESAVLSVVLMDADSRRRMPKSRGEEGDEAYRPPLDEEEKALLRDWIVQLADPPAPGAAPAPAMTAAPAPSAAVSAVPKTAPATPAPASLPAGGTPDAPAEQPEEPEEPALSQAELDAAYASNPGDLPEGIDLEAQVHWILAERCSQCHTGDYEPELNERVNLAALFEQPFSGSRVSVAERVVEVVLLDDDDTMRMPRSRGSEGARGFREPLDESEKAVLTRWLEAGRGEATARDFITQREVIEAIYEDLRGASESSQRFYRYFTLTNLHNATDEHGMALVPDLDTHRAAISKLINSLSMHAKITRPHPIDEAETIYRIDLRDYQWHPDDWENVVYFYPHGMLGIDRQKEQLIERYTGSRMAYLRGDWFTFAAAQPPLYDQIMDKLLGFTVSGEDDDVLAKLEKALGVDRVDNLKNGRAIRAGFQFSGVSEANRLIERHELGSHPGAYWVSYDFTPLSAKRTQDLKLAPLGPKEAHLTTNPDHIFDHDGGEMIYNLPNGLQGYMLTTEEGKRLDRAPIEIVQDANRQDNVILNGISCIACHDQGIKPAIRAPDPTRQTLMGMMDEVRPSVEASGILDFSERNLLQQLYADPETLQAAVREDFERFKLASAEATGGLEGSREPVIGLYNEYRAPVTSRKMASEFGLDHDVLIELLKKESHRSEVLSVIASSMERGIPFRRENLLREYIAVVYALGYELMPFVPLGYEDFGGKSYAELVASSDQYLAAFGGANYDFASSKAAVLTDSKATETLSHESVLLEGGGKLRLSIQPKLKIGQRANLEVVATEEAHLRIFHLSSDEHVTELFPGSSGKATLRPRNRKLSVSWETTAPGGAEHIVVFASKVEVKNLASGVTAGDFKVFNRGAIFSTRGIPTAVRVSELGEETGTAARLVQARISYLLEP